MRWWIPALLGPVVLATGTLPVRAADIVPQVSPPARGSDAWTGFYLGANLGAGFGSNQFSNAPPGSAPALGSSSSVGGWIGGLQLGYNYQLNWLVLGIEGSFDWAGLKNNSPCASGQLCQAEPEWFGTVVGRVGGTFGSALVYIDGGAAWTHDTMTNVFSADTFMGDQIRFGWTLGAGIEYRLYRNWSVKLEYDYMMFGQQSIRVADSVASSFPENVGQSIQLIKAGFNYRFNSDGSVPPTSHASEAGGDDSPKSIRALPSLSVGKDSVDGLVAGLFALGSDSLEKSGPRLYLSGGYGWYQFPATSGRVTGIYSTGAILGGYGWVKENFEVNLLAGVSAENDLLSALDPSDPVHGTQGGVMVRGDVTANPTAKTLIEGEAEFTSAFDAYYTAAKFGYDAFGKGIFVGPMVGALGDARFHQWRVGAAISDIKLFSNVELELAAGYMNDSSVGTGAFGDIGFTIDF
jgi:outer membrane immunogenic protein